MKISDIDLSTIKSYLKVEHTFDDTLLYNALAASKSFIKSYTGLDDAGIENKEDLALVVLVIVNEMYSNREYTVDKNTLNPVITSILNMYCVNLL